MRSDGGLLPVQQQPERKTEPLQPTRSGRFIKSRVYEEAGGSEMSVALSSSGSEGQLL